MARFKSEFLASYYGKKGTPLRALVLGRIHEISNWASPFARLLNPWLKTSGLRLLNEFFLGLDRRRALPLWATHTLAAQWKARHTIVKPKPVVLFNDTFTNYYHPEIGMAVATLCDSAGIGVDLGPNVCCARPLISQGLLPAARRRGAEAVRQLHPLVAAGKRIIVIEPSCLSALRDDLPSLLRGTVKRQAREVADACLLFEEWLEGVLEDGLAQLSFRAGPSKLLLHGHCHQKSLGLVEPAQALLERLPHTEVVSLDAGCCGMAGSFGYVLEHFDVSRRIGERRLLPAARALEADEVLVSSGTSCRHQVMDLAGIHVQHPAELLASLLTPT